MEYQTSHSLLLASAYEQGARMTIAKVLELMRGYKKGEIKAILTLAVQSKDNARKFLNDEPLYLKYDKNWKLIEALYNDKTAQ